jgi:hypothetical protein
VEAALTAQPALEPTHRAVVALVIVAKQVQQAVQREYPQLGPLAVARFARLPSRHAAGDHDLTQEGLRAEG